MHGIATAPRRRSFPSTIAVPTTVLLACGSLGPALFIGLAFVESATRSGYDPLRHQISLLALSPDGWQQIANFLSSGLLVLAGALGLIRAARQGLVAVPTAWLVGGFGLGLLLAGVCVTDPYAGYPVGASEPSAPSLHGLGHIVGGYLCFLGIAAASWVEAIHCVGQRRWGWAIGSFLVGLVVMGSFATVSKLGVPAGLAQRVAVVAGWGWLSLLAWRARGRAAEGVCYAGRRPGATSPLS
jgi:hypothetical protein